MSTKIITDEQVSAAIRDDIDFLEDIIREAFDRRRRVLAEGIFERLLPMVGAVTPAAGSVSEAWTPIESLSQLRSIVGGRFTKLKERWINAGLPLREHRGDRAQTATVEETGWLELTRWIYEQGFEARRAAEDGEVLFELRPLISVEKR